MVYDWPLTLGKLLFPPTCILCNRPGSPPLDLCSSCHAGLRENDHACARCALPLPPQTPRGVLCGRCIRREPRYDALLAPWLYQGKMAELIRLLKFQEKLAAGRVLGGLLAQALGDIQRPPQLLLPVPLHADQLKARGFNHAAEITRALARTLDIPWSAGLLEKQRLTRPQHGLGRRERLDNLRGAFRFKNKHGVFHHVAIVDDVVTTGSTVGEIAGLLKRNGVTEVSVWALARTPAEHRRHQPARRENASS